MVAAKFCILSQVSEFRKSLNLVNSACEEVHQRFYWYYSFLYFLSNSLSLMHQVRNSGKLKEIMKKILYLGNKLNEGTARGTKPSNLSRMKWFCGNTLQWLAVDTFVTDLYWSGHLRLQFVPVSQFLVVYWCPNWYKLLGCLIRDLVIQIDF